MAVRKLKHVPTPAEQVKARQVADRVARAKAAHPPRGVEYYVLAGELAASLGADPGDIMDHFDERAALREYDGGLTRQEAERLGWQDCEEFYVRQRRLA